MRVALLGLHLQSLWFGHQADMCLFSESFQGGFLSLMHLCAAPFDLFYRISPNPPPRTGLSKNYCVLQSTSRNFGEYQCPCRDGDPFVRRPHCLSCSCVILCMSGVHDRERAACGFELFGTFAPCRSRFVSGFDACTRSPLPTDVKCCTDF